MATVGATTAPSTNTVYYDSLLSTTLFNYRDVLYDNIFKSSAFLTALRKAGGVEEINGGERIARQLMYADSGNVRSYQGYEVLDTTPADGFTQCFYEWREIAATISISRREERQNSGEAAIMDLLRQKTVQAEMSLKEKVITQILQGTVYSSTFVPGANLQDDANTRDLNPLGYFLPENPTADPSRGGNVGNISRATYSWWRPITAGLGAAGMTSDTFTLNCTTLRGLKMGLYRVWNHCSKGADGSGPNLIVSDQVSYETYENSLDYDKRYTDTDMAEMGFDTIRLKGGTFVWDELVPDVKSGTTTLTYGTAFFLNTKFFKLFVDAQTNFVTTPFQEAFGQTARTAKVLFMGNTGITNMRKNGVAGEISLSITS